MKQSEESVDKIIGTHWPRPVLQLQQIIFNFSAFYFINKLLITPSEKKQKKNIRNTNKRTIFSNINE